MKKVNEKPFVYSNKCNNHGYYYHILFLKVLGKGTLHNQIKIFLQVNGFNIILGLSVPFAMIVGFALINLVWNLSPLTWQPYKHCGPLHPLGLTSWSDHGHG